ncbi:DUF4373 domain-containing protein [Candidatus Marinimicrobia bacterium]|nr:DUF4373 domain-containing protein [Candidatus Neomarinimicrobiota bacterium]
MARKQKNYVDYFPHDTHQSKAVRIISKKYGNDGYAFYYKLRELLGRTDNYNYDLSEQIDWFDFLGEMAIKEEQAKELIEFLVTIGELDKELWEQDKRLWSNSLIEDISDVYNKRKAKIPHKYSFRDGNTDSRSGNPSLGDGSTQSKVKEKKVNKSKVVSESAPTTVDLKAFADKYKTIDIPLSYKKFNLNQQSKGVKSNNEAAGFEMWVLRDIENEWNLRAPESNMGIETGDTLATVYCPNCDAKREVNRGNEAREAFCQCGHQMYYKNEYLHEKELITKDNVIKEDLPF